MFAREGWKALGLQATKLTLSLSRADDTPRPPLENMRILDMLGRLKFLEWLGVHACHWNKEVHSGGIDLAFLWVLVDKSGSSLKHLNLIGHPIGKITPAERSAVLLSLLARLPCHEELRLKDLKLTLGLGQIKKANIFTALKDMHLEVGDVTQESLDDLLSCCPLLTNLSVVLWLQHPLDLVIKSPILCELTIRHSDLVVPHINTPSLYFAAVVSKNEVVFHSHQLEALVLTPCKLSAPPFSKLKHLELYPLLGPFNPTEQIHQLGTLVSIETLKIAEGSRSGEEKPVNVEDRVHVGSFCSTLGNLQHLEIMSPRFYKCLVVSKGCYALQCQQRNLQTLEIVLPKRAPASCRDTLLWFIKNSPQLRIVKVHTVRGVKILRDCLASLREGILEIMEMFDP